MAEYTIGDVAEAVGLSVHALRFYEREGLLLKPVPRSAGGRRHYDESDIEWLRICTRLRGSQMPLSELRRFAELVRTGPGNEADRLALLDAHRARVEAQIRALKQARDIIAWKTEVYGEKLRVDQVDGLWDPTARVPE